MFRILSNKIGIWCGVLLCSSSYFYADENLENIDKVKEIYNYHYDSFKKSVLSERKWVNRLNDVFYLGDSGLKQGARGQGYDEFVVNTCIPASYSFFKREENDIEIILQKIGSDDNIIGHISVLLNKCKQKPNDIKFINFVARTTYDEGKRIEQERIKQGYIISAEDKDTWTAIGLFAKYVMVDKEISF